MKQFSLPLALAFLLTVSTVVAAEETAPNTGSVRMPATVDTIKEKRADFIGQSKELRTDLQEQRKELVGNLKESRSELETRIKANREELKNEIQNIKKERVSIRKSFVEQRFDAAIKVITANQARVETKIDELEGKGYDLDAAHDHLEESKAAIKKAADLLATLKATAVSDSDENTATKPREIAKQIEEQLKSARTHLIEAITSIRNVTKPAEAEEDDSAS